MNDEQTATPGRKSLLDQIHAVKEFAERWGYPDLAEWIAKDADEPCPAAIAQAMEMDAEVSKPPRGLSPRNPANGRISGPPESIDGATDRIEKELSATPPSEPSRTGAVKAAVAKLEEVRADHALCPVAGCSVKAGEVILAALAAAERKLADEQARATAAENSAGRLELRAFDLSRQLEAVEKRAKDAEARIAFHHCKPPLGNPTREEAMALVDEFQDECDRRVTNERTLTRKLATALEGLEQVAFLVDHFRQCPHNTMRNPHERESECLAQVARDTIAAIDAPAGEVASEFGPLTDAELGTPDVIAWTPVAIVTPDAAPPPEPTNAQAPANGAHPFGACCPMTAPPFCPCPCHTNPVAEPVANVLLDALTTPASAQGSEGAEVSVQRQRTEVATERAHAQQGRTDTSPSAPRFTAEEARQEAGLLQHEGNASPRTQATLRHYAAILERDDALERAAEGLIESWDMGERGTALDGFIRRFRSIILAQRAGEVE